MVIIGKKVFGIEPDDSPINKFMREFDPEYVELYTSDTMVESCPLSVDASGYKTTTTIFGMNLETAQEIYKGKAIYVCPD